MEKLEDLKWLASITGLRKSKVHELVASGAIPAILLLDGKRRTFRVRPSEIEKWVRAREVANG